MGNVATSLPLFETSKRRVLKTLHVRRFEEGRWVGAPQRFEDGELGDREAVRARFGGGRYEVIARDGCKIVGRTRFVLDGPSRSLGGEAAVDIVGADGEERFATATASGKRTCSICSTRGSTSSTWSNARASRRRL